jgi:hypothetical protein
MTDSPAPMLNPQITGKAERALGAILDRLLARTGTSFPQWTILAVTAAKGGSADRDQLVAAIADGKIPESKKSPPGSLTSRPMTWPPQAASSLP